MYLSTEAISPETHRQWFTSSLANPDRHMYIGDIRHAGKLGICRFDVGGDLKEAEVFLTLNPAMRGQNLSSILLKLSIDRFRESGVPGLRLWAKIRPGNTPSIRCFSSAGFMLSRGEGQWNFYTLRAIPDGI